MAIRRHYIETTDVSGSTEAQVALAEQLIDQYVGPQNKRSRGIVRGQITSLLGSGTIIVDDNTTTQLAVTNGQFKGQVLEMISGDQAGKSAVISSSDKDDKSVTLRAAFGTNPEVGDYFKIYQLAKFPRVQDSLTSPDGLNVFPTIPDAVRAACIAQVEFIMAKGDGYFTGDTSDFQSESFLNYSYSRGSGSDSQSAIVKLISPQARTLLRGIVNRTGRLVVGGPGNVSI